MTRVRWRLTWSDPPPVTGDLLVRYLAAGEDPGPEWTVVPHGGAAWWVATGAADELNLTGVLVVAPGPE